MFFLVHTMEVSKNMATPNRTIGFPIENQQFWIILGSPLRKPPWYPSAYSVPPISTWVPKAGAATAGELQTDSSHKIPTLDL